MNNAPLDSAPPLPGLYIHIPFCRGKCPYCDFYSSTELGLVDGFLAGAAREMDQFREMFPLVDTVYLGGGTPSVLGMDKLSFLWRQITDKFILTGRTEVTIEVNPGDDLPYPRLLDIGFNRINLGVQSFSNKTLEFLGRRHNVTLALRSIEEAHRAGFNNIGIDLIYGTPTEDLADFLCSLTLAASLPITHLSCYQLTLEKDTPLCRRRQAGEFELPGEEAQRSFFLETSRGLEGLGFSHYEVSNFAKGEIHESRHNRKYWRHLPYLGIGPGAHSFLGNRRWWNPPDLEQYLSGLARGEAPAMEGENLSPEELLTETIYLGLRTKRGIDLGKIKTDYHRDLWEEKKEVLQGLLRDGLLIKEGERLSPTREGMALADSLALLF
ncbi:MAG: radical SAM family heme chaperone HemW [Smithellaceae bacterium]|nr:radical SAM family heme chaperone HemW [Smithellaceae bacterium]